ncbi:biotin carboxylase [Ammoniphilus oxalaticus]|uniref:biotin carboxylase n=1 Tax=Ammoniphilus oxalaticus TaxID=66863 RepID=A0A419SKY5_9BACL|nr:acetyl-CoA carboxylase biotin carboxylase subunit [Ammoniphilus oxalaticus]RKD24677.1 biotin carboxylase [Ammoniphilus oxalaticus]
MQKLLIANRGEIARRIIRTCQSRGIKTVAIYSEADQGMPFVREADERVLIGPAPVAQSYLQIEKVIAAAKQTGAQGIHPGYGLLAENPLLAQRCRQEGILFIGPKPKVIEAMGDKLKARKWMEQAGLPVIPGSNEEIQSVEQALPIAARIGYPLMLKASAGGGGIGMQLCYDEQQLIDTFQSIQTRAQVYFGNGALFIEKYIDHPRHIEAQIAADEYGSVIHLFERECSVQRRHQKVIEESPSPFLDTKLREQICEAAVRAARFTQYTGVGTVEFIVGADCSFYFLEMNTRLQVEHTVTEEITGVDLVGMQLDLAEGKRLPVKQHDLQVQGHAIEMRIYAEDPQTFFPSPGKISVYKKPRGNNIRIDDGVEQGSQVTPFYDPMIAKLIVSGKTRAESLREALLALRAFKIEGIKTNIPLLEKVINHSQFQQGSYDTTFIERVLLKD